MTKLPFFIFAIVTWCASSGFSQSTDPTSKQGRSNAAQISARAGELPDAPQPPSAGNAIISINSMDPQAVEKTAQIVAVNLSKSPVQMVKVRVPPEWTDAQSQAMLDKLQSRALELTKRVFHFQKSTETDLTAANKKDGGLSSLVDRFNADTNDGRISVGLKTQSWWAVSAGGSQAGLQLHSKGNHISAFAGFNEYSFHAMPNGRGINDPGFIATMTIQ